MDQIAGDLFIDEFVEFADRLCVFRKYDTIIREGDRSDTSLYLLRQGSVGVYRTVEKEDILIDCIDALNFFGEFEFINGVPRKGTVRALSDEVITYRFSRNELQTILTNPVWGEILIVRLSKDLMEFSDRYVKNEASINHLLDERETTRQRLFNLFSLVDQVFSGLLSSGTSILMNREYINSLRLMIRKYLALKIPDVSYQIEKSSPVGIRQMYDENLIPEKLMEILNRR